MERPESGHDPKTIQLIVTPGFQTPQWLLSQIPSCDGLFQSPSQTPPSTCGKATFMGYKEGGDSTELPLAWNPVYKSAFQTFLGALAARYGSNPAFVAIAVAGPTAASAEMILPNDNNTPAQAQLGGILPNDMWRQLVAFHYNGMTAYQKSDQGIIDEWNAAIDMYGAIFSGVTLVATVGNGLPNLGPTGFAIPPAFSSDCGKPDMDCAAETTILSHFVDPTVGRANAKATQTSGMEASRADQPNLSVGGVKRLSQSTALSTAPTVQILGGAQFNTSFSDNTYNTLKEGCTSTFPPTSSEAPAGCIPSACTAQACPVACVPQACLAPGITPADLASFKTVNKAAKNLIPSEQAEYNVLSVYCDGTAAASSFGGTQGAAPLNYLQIYSPDVLYAEANVNAPAQVVETGGGASVMMSAQDLLNRASQKLLEISEPAAAITSVGLGVSSTHIGSFLQGQTTAAYTVFIQNSGSGATTGIVSGTDTLPAGLTATAINGPGCEELPG
jgi:hypothetical protein